MKSPPKTISHGPDVDGMDALCFKNVYPFRLATTSFIFRAGYAENVQRLGSWVDEIELLFFESRTADACPTQRLIDKLGRLAAELDISYNIHLPIDVDPGSLLASRRNAARQVLTQFIRQTLPLSPTSYTLHLPYTMDACDPDSIRYWQAGLTEVIEAILQDGFDPGLICVENLDYPFERAAEIVERYHLGVCFDIGHLMLQKGNPDAFYKRYRDKINIIHLHGVRGRQDHRSLDCIDLKIWNTIRPQLESFQGTVSLEVFSYADLRRSLGFFDRRLLNAPMASDGT